MDGEINKTSLWVVTAVLVDTLRLGSTHDHDGDQNYQQMGIDLWALCQTAHASDITL